MLKDAARGQSSTGNCASAFCVKKGGFKVQSSLIGKIEKAKRYALEPERIAFNRFEATFRGEHNDYDVSYEQGRWRCSCTFFATRDICSHTLALEKILGEMLPQEALSPEVVPGL